MLATAAAAGKGATFGDFGPVDIWGVTRQADVVAVATVESIGPEIVARVTHLVKGEVKGETISFPRPPEPALSAKEFRCPPPRAWRFRTGDSWLLFLKAAGSGYSFIEAVPGQAPFAEQGAKDALAVDAITDPREKVRMLVALCLRPRPAPMAPLYELQKANTEANYDLLRPLGQVASLRAFYIDLLCANHNPGAEAELRAMLGTESGANLRDAIDAYGRKGRENVEVPEAIVPFMKHPDPRIRSTAVFILYVRDYRPAQAQAAKALADPDAGVRRMALAWPWWAYEKEHPEIRAKIKQMRSDPDAMVRDAAKRALAGMSAWYRFWYLGH